MFSEPNSVATVLGDRMTISVAQFHYPGHCSSSQISSILDSTTVLLACFLLNVASWDASILRCKATYFTLLNALVNEHLEAYNTL